MANVNRTDLGTIILTTPITAAATTLSIANGDAAIMPEAPFYATLMPASDVANKSNSEILYFVSSTVSGGNTTYQIQRAQKGTTAKAWESGAILANAVYVGDLDAVPVNSIVDYDGDDVPDGWEEVAGGDDDWVETTISTSHSDGTAKYLKVNGVVYVTAMFSSKAPSGETGVLFTLPVGYRPTTQLNVPVGGDIAAAIGTNGQVTISGITNGFNYGFTVSFPVSGGGSS